MISQKCPKCLSSRVRRGYRPTPFWSKILFRYNLLCDNCNWEFTGFAVPGTVSAKPTRSPKKKPVAKFAEETSLNLNNAAGNLRDRSGEEAIQEEDSPLEKNGVNKDIAVEEISAGENGIDAPLSESAGTSKKNAKRKSGV